MTARHAREILAVAGIGFLSPFLHAQTVLQIVTESLPNVTVGTAYNQPLATSGGTCSSDGTASSTIDVGALPPGISVISPAVHQTVVPSGNSLRGGHFSLHRPRALDYRLVSTP